jgi:hypothetical protein
MVVVEAATVYAREQYRAAWRQRRVAEAALEGVYTTLRALGQRDPGAMRALEAFESSFRIVKTELAAGDLPNPEPARRLMAAGSRSVS